MGPKKAPSKKPKKTIPSTTDPSNLAELERKAMIKTAASYANQTKKEDAAFNEFQQQREKLNYFWIVEKKNLEDKKADLRNKEREVQDLEEKHTVSIKIYKQRVKHLLFEHANELTKVKTSGELTLKSVQDGHRGLEGEIKVDKRGLGRTSKENELSHEDYLTSLKKEQDKNITVLRTEFDRKTSELHKTYTKKTKVLRDSMEHNRKSETMTIEDRKNAHIKQLMKSHEIEFGDIKNYYNDITHNNLDLIKSLKDEVSELKKKELSDESKMNEIYHENRRMSEPLKKAQVDVNVLTSDLKKYNAEKEDLRFTKSRLLVVEDKYRTLKWQNEVTCQRYETVESELLDLRTRFNDTIHEATQKSGFRNLLLEKKLGGMNAMAEAQNASVNEVLSRSNLSSSEHMQMKSRITDIFASKTQLSNELQSELERITNAYSELVESAKEKMEEFGVPVAELGFVPIGVGELRHV